MKFGYVTRNIRATPQCPTALFLLDGFSHHHETIVVMVKGAHNPFAHGTDLRCFQFVVNILIFRSKPRDRS